MSTDYKTRIREAILADLPDHDTLYNAPGQIGDGRLDGGLVGRPRLNGNRSLKLAAVLVPVVDYENEPKILLTRRADHLAQHSGQVAFPGGKVEAEDGGPVSAALREAQEEIGLAAEYVEVAGFLSTYETGSGFRILPVVGFVRPGFQLEIDHNEVAETFEVPLELMINEANYNRHEIEWEGRMEAYYAVEYEGYNIWGRDRWHVAQSQQEDADMMRVILWNLFLFLLPFVLTALWAMWVRRSSPREAVLRSWSQATLVGAILVITSLLVWRFATGDAPEKTYIPPALKDGQVVPGRFE